MKNETKVTLKKLPMHKLRSELKKNEIVFKSSDSKDDLIEMIKSGETIHKPKETKAAPRLEDHKREEKVLPMVPESIREELAAMKRDKNLDWTIDEDSCSITFIGNIKQTTTLDQSDNNILRAARSSFANRRPIERGVRQGQSWRGVDLD